MKREISREKNVDAFSINLDELERFCKKIASRFPQSDDVSFSINVDLENERLTFDSVDELKEFDELSKSINSFHIFFLSRSFNKNIHLRSSRFSLLGLGQASISATANSEGWCADVIETAVSILKKKQSLVFLVL